MIRIDFSRREAHATYGSFRCRGDDAWMDLFRLLTDRGWRDDSAEMFDERGMRCWTIASIHKGAARYRPNAGDLMAKEARDKVREAARKAPRASGLHGQGVRA